MAKNKPNKWQSRIVGHDKVRADQLLANPRNHRRHPQKQREVVAASIEELGFCKSVIVNQRTGYIVDGHERVMQALGAGDETLVDVEYVDLSEEDERKLLLILDASSELAEVDACDLEELLRSVNTQSDILGAWFTELAESSSFLEINDDLQINEDDVPVPPADAITKKGDLWLLGEHRLLCGDSTKAEDVARLMQGQKADLWLTDPPYNVDYTGKTKDALKVENDSMGDSQFRNFLLECFTKAFSAMKPGAAFYIWHADSEGYNFRGAVVDCKQKVRQCLIWKKQTMVMGRQDYQWKHEPCLYGWKDGASHQWFSDRKQTTILEFDRPSRSQDHPTMKPVALIAYQIGNSLGPQGLVYDSFLGSGTTLIAAEQLGRKCYGMEISPQYCDVIVKRWEALTGRQAVLEEVSQ